MTAGTHESIVTKEEFDQAQAALRDFREQPSHTTGNLLARKIRCGVCGHILSRSFGKEKFYYCRMHKFLENSDRLEVHVPEKELLAAISKKVKRNNGQARPKYYVENTHPAIIDPITFGRVQEELARRTGKRKVKQVGTKTEQGRYSSKYALTELLVCGECGTPYRRCTWTVKGEKKAVWRCIDRLDFGKKYCRHSPTMEESALQEAIVSAHAHGKTEHRRAGNPKVAHRHGIGHQ